MSESRTDELAICFANLPAGGQLEESNRGIFITVFHNISPSVSHLFQAIYSTELIGELIILRTCQIAQTYKQTKKSRKSISSRSLTHSKDFIDRFLDTC